MKEHKDKGSKEERRKEGNSGMGEGIKDGRKYGEGKKEGDQIIK